MKSIILKMATNHPELVVYQDGNNFGDQIIIFRHEAKNGKITEKAKSFREGNWMPFEKKSLLKLWAQL